MVCTACCRQNTGAAAAMDIEDVLAIPVLGDSDLSVHRDYPVSRSTAGLTSGGALLVGALSFQQLICHH